MNKQLLILFLLTISTTHLYCSELPAEFIPSNYKPTEQEEDLFFSPAEGDDDLYAGRENSSLSVGGDNTDVTVNQARKFVDLAFKTGVEQGRRYEQEQQKKKTSSFSLGSVGVGAAVALLAVHGWSHLSHK